MPTRTPGAVAVTAVFSVVLAVSAVLPARAEDDSKLQKTLKDSHAEGVEHWIYNDIPAARKKARAEGKPLFVTFRCVPCKACAGFDAEVAKGSEVIEKLARERFVAVRQVEMKGVDLSLFQFDHDLNWAAMFIHPDGTVYARYGTQSAAGPDAYNSIAGLEKTMRRVLELHAAYPENKAELRGKRAAQKAYRTALEMPGLENKEKLRGETKRDNCIHCHNIHDAEQLQAQDSGTFEEDMLWRYPLPENIGLSISPEDGLLIREVLPDSAAAAAGIEAGESLTRAGGQVLASIADLQWVLHHLPNETTRLEVRTERTGEHTLRLAAGWKKTDISWRGSIWSLRPRLRVWAPELAKPEREKLGIPPGRSAYEVRWINTSKPGGRSARDCGLREGDIIVALAGKSVSMTTAELNVHIKLHYEVGDELPLTVLRDGERREIKVRLVE